MVVEAGNRYSQLMVGEEDLSDEVCVVEGMMNAYEVEGVVVMCSGKEAVWFQLVVVVIDDDE